MLENRRALLDGRAHPHDRGDLTRSLHAVLADLDSAIARASRALLPASKTVSGTAALSDLWGGGLQAIQRPARGEHLVQVSEKAQ